MGNVCQDCCDWWVKTYTQAGETVTYNIVADADDCEECEGEGYTDPDGE